MGTRADFYVEFGEHAEWLGSIAWDGNPGGIPEGIRQAATEQAYREQVATFLNERADGTKPEQGWPWPWADSGTTDYAYAFTNFDDDGPAVFGSHFGSRWHPVTNSGDWHLGDCCDDCCDDAPQRVPFPDMSDRQNVTYGERSGVIIL